MTQSIRRRTISLFLWQSLSMEGEHGFFADSFFDELPGAELRPFSFRSIDDAGEHFFSTLSICSSSY